MGFERVTVAAGGTPALVTFTVGANQLGLVDEDGNTQLVAGKHSIEVSNGAHSIPLVCLISQAYKQVLILPVSPPPFALAFIQFACRELSYDGLSTHIDTHVHTYNQRIE